MRAAAVDIVGCDEIRLHCPAHQQMLNLGCDLLSYLDRHRDFFRVFIVVVTAFFLFESISRVSPELHRSIQSAVCKIVHRSPDVECHPLAVPTLYSLLARNICIGTSKRTVLEMAQNTAYAWEQRPEYIRACQTIIPPGRAVAYCKPILADGACFDRADSPQIRLVVAG